MLTDAGCFQLFSVLPRFEMPADVGARVARRVLFQVAHPPGGTVPPPTTRPDQSTHQGTVKTVTETLKGGKGK